MFTAMIIDDEKTVRDGIEELIQWEKAGFRLGTSGKDGRDGLANILRENPDLVLNDRVREHGEKERPSCDHGYLHCRPSGLDGEKISKGPEVRA